MNGTQRTPSYEMIESMLKQTRHGASSTQEPARWQLAEEAHIRNVINLMAHAPPELFTERQRAYMKQVSIELPQLYPRLFVWRLSRIAFSQNSKASSQVEKFCMWHLDVCASLSRAAYLDRAEEIKEAILNWRIISEADSADADFHSTVQILLSADNVGVAVQRSLSRFSDSQTYRRP